MELYNISNKTIFILMFITLTIYYFLDEPINHPEPKPNREAISYSEFRNRYPNEDDTYYLDCWAGSAEEESFLESKGF